MAYFPNGTEGMDYEERYCSRCVHYHQEDECAVLIAHTLYNYEQCADESSILHILIPRSEDGLTNEKCRMFADWDEARRDRIAGLLEQAKEHVPQVAVYGIDHRAIEEALK